MYCALLAILGVPIKFEAHGYGKEMQDLRIDVLKYEKLLR